jgi:hypothetical protein
MTAPRTPGWIYVLASTSHPGVVKVGRTSKHTPGRMQEIELDANYAAFGPWSEVWSRAVADCAHVETAAHRMLANRRVKLDRLPCRELFRVDETEACRVVEAAAGSLIVARMPLPRAGRRLPVRVFRRGGGRRWSGRAMATIAAVPFLLWVMAVLLR